MCFGQKMPRMQSWNFGYRLKMNSCKFLMRKLKLDWGSQVKFLKTLTKALKNNKKGIIRWESFIKSNKNGIFRHKIPQKTNKNFIFMGKIFSHNNKNVRLDIKFFKGNISATPKLNSTIS
jgi:hypothetical protein